MSAPEFQEKFIGFIDVLGFKQMIEGAERGKGRTLIEIKEILAELGHTEDKARFEKSGPRCCPYSAVITKGMNFEVTQVSDCAIVSAEVSPAGVINLVDHIWGAAMMLLTKGVLVRGYITKGKIYHQGNDFYGTGYHEAYQREVGVSAFKREADEKGTPFVEVDPIITNYIANNTDECVRKMFDRMVKRDGGTTALFPFKRLSHSFIIAGAGMPPFNPDKEKLSNDNLRKGIQNMKGKLLEYVDPTNVSAMSKVAHYIAALDDQLKMCDTTDEMIDKLSAPFGRRL